MCCSEECVYRGFNSQVKDASMCSQVFGLCQGLTALISSAVLKKDHLLLNAVL
jgi:hypothetical protein